MTKKDQLTNLLHTIRDHQLAFDSYLSPAERDEIGTADSWSAKDDIAHSIYWANFQLAILEAHERGEPAPPREYEDFQDQNDANFERYRDTGWQDVKSMISDAYASVDAFVARSDEEALLVVPQGRSYPVWRDIAGSYIIHPAIHLWTYLEKHGYGDLRRELLGDTFLDQLLALDGSEGWRGVNYYNIACIYALAGDSAQAIKYLTEALQLQPDLTDWSKQDSDLDSLRDLPAYQALYTPS